MPNGPGEELVRRGVNTGGTHTRPENSVARRKRESQKIEGKREKSRLRVTGQGG